LVFGVQRGFIGNRDLVFDVQSGFTEPEIWCLVYKVDLQETEI